MDVPGEGVVDGVRRDEEVTDGGEDRNEALTAPRQAKFLHDALSFSQRQVAVLRPVIQALVGQMPDCELQFASGGSIGSQLVGDHASGPETLFYSAAASAVALRLWCSCGSAGFRREYSHPDRRRATASVACRQSRSGPRPDARYPLHLRPCGLAAQRAGKGHSKLHAPPADRLIRHDNSTFEQHLLDQTEAQGKPKIQPHRMRDQLTRKTMPFVAHYRLAHRRHLPHHS